MTNWIAVLKYRTFQPQARASRKSPILKYCNVVRYHKNLCHFMSSPPDELVVYGLARMLNKHVLVVLADDRSWSTMDTVDALTLDFEIFHSDLTLVYWGKNMFSALVPRKDDQYMDEPMAPVLPDSLIKLAGHPKDHLSVPDNTPAPPLIDNDENNDDVPTTGIMTLDIVDGDNHKKIGSLTIMDQKDMPGYTTRSRVKGVHKTYKNMDVSELDDPADNMYIPQAESEDSDKNLTIEELASKLAAQNMPENLEGITNNTTPGANLSGITENTVPPGPELLTDKTARKGCHPGLRSTGPVPAPEADPAATSPKPPNKNPKKGKSPHKAAKTPAPVKPSKGTVRKSTGGKKPPSTPTTHSNWYNTCSSSTITYSQYKGGLLIHTHGIPKRKVDARLPCDLCDKRFPDVKILNEHYHNVHKFNKPCGICREKFSTPNALKRHEYDHHADCFHCKQCPEGYVFQSGLKRHMLIHKKQANSTAVKDLTE